MAERSRPPGSEAADRLCLPDEDIFSLRIAPAVLPDRGHGNVTRSSPWTDRGASQRKVRTLVNVQTVQTTASQRPRSTSHLSDPMKWDISTPQSGYCRLSFLKMEAVATARSTNQVRSQIYLCSRGEVGIS